MAKKQSQYVCNSCGRITPVFMGKCPKCGQFGTMEEEMLVSESTAVAKNRRAHTYTQDQPQRLADITSDGVERLPLAITEFSRVLGGGLVPGSLVLLGGEPGIGKSTLLLDVAALVANQHGLALYVSGEE
ncbi:MAG: AAA family ATPase, partial [Chloroflexi bacterium]|nr:AAA family ATPase [Chloroflexota bacterium]